MRNALLTLLAAATIGVAALGGAKAVGWFHREPAAAATATRPAPADAQIDAAEGAIERSPDDAEGYNLLCSAYMRKARETGDFGMNEKAKAALDRSLELAPDNPDGLKLHAALLLTYHRFGDALEAARRAERLLPDDHDVYGALTDALVELGDYPAAVEAAQRMVDLRPDTSSYARVSYLRALHGDSEGAIEAMTDAARSASPTDPESIAWCYVHLGDELMNDGKPAPAERAYDVALAAFPDYHLGLAAKARARVAAGDYDAAVDLYNRALERVPLPDTAAALGDLYAKLGRADDAKREYALVEAIEQASAAAGTYSRQLALFWADHDTRLEDALAIARSERAARADVFTCDALAWCLYKTGDYAGAKSASDEALRLGTRDPRILYHAGMIDRALGDAKGAAAHLADALRMNPSFDVLGADVARRALAGLSA